MKQPCLSLQTLWDSLQRNPNDLTHLRAWIERHQELSGNRGACDGLRRAADLPGSWLARIWLTRELLADGALDASMSIYRDVLQRAPKKSLAVQEIAGHLGKAGYFRETIDLLLPLYSPDDHGPWAGFNLFNACEDAGDLESAQVVLNRMEAARWPDEPESRYLRKIVRIRQEKLRILRDMRAESHAKLN